MKMDERKRKESNCLCGKSGIEVIVVAFECAQEQCVYLYVSECVDVICA